MTAITGGLGQLAYAAANAHLDALAWQLSRQRRFKVLSVNWDTWRGVGMAASHRLPDGVGLSEAEGVEVFERLIEGDVPAQVLVSTLPMAQQMARVRGLEGADAVIGQATSRQTLHERPSLSTPFEPAAGMLAQRLQAIWSACLGIAPIGVNDNFFELNGDSLLAIQLLSRIRGEFGVEVEPSAFFQRPRIADVAELIETKWIEDIEGAGAPTSSPDVNAPVTAARSL